MCSARRSTIASKGGIRRVPSVVSHADNLEVLLIRISHWLWKWYRAEDRPQYLSEAIDYMAVVKFQYRKPLRENRQAAAERMRRVVQRRKAQG